MCGVDSIHMQPADVQDPVGTLQRLSVDPQAPPYCGQRAVKRQSRFAQPSSPAIASGDMPPTPSSLSRPP